MIFSYRTKFGTFTICPQRTDPKRVELWLGDECYGSYFSAGMAASDVAAHATGHAEWDLASNLEAPEDLTNWQRS